jgi:hypothetical protein
MSVWRELGCVIALALFVSCGGGSTGGAPPPPSMLLSTTAVTVSSYAQDPYLATATVNLIISGTMPSSGIYVGGEFTGSGIDTVSAVATSNNTMALTINFKYANTMAVGTYSDTITVTAATDQAGTNQIANSPQTIHTTYKVLLSPPQFTNLSPASAYVGGPAFKLTVTGNGFPPDAQILWNGSPMPTTFVSATVLTATIPAQAIAAAGSAQVSVGGPDVATSDPVAFSIDNSQAIFLNLAATDFAWDGVNQVIYASILSDEATNPNSIVVIDPVAGQVTKIVSTGAAAYPPLMGPTGLAISDDCSFLYAFIYVNQSGERGVIQRFFLPSLTLDTSFSIPFAIDPTYGISYAMALQVAPGAPHTIAVARGLGSWAGGIAIFDDAVQRGPALLNTQDGLHYFTSLQWGADSTTVYAADGYTAAGEFAAMSVAPDGPALLTDQMNVLMAGGHDLHFVPATGNLYVGNGQVLQPTTGQTLGTCGTGWAGMVPDPALGIGFYLDWHPQNPPGGQAIAVRTYDLTHYTALSSTIIPTLAIPNANSFTPTRILRCGPRMLALGGSGDGNLCILTGPFAQGQ